MIQTKIVASTRLHLSPREGHFTPKPSSTRGFWHQSRRMWTFEWGASYFYHAMLSRRWEGHKPLYWTILYTTRVQLVTLRSCSHSAKLPVDITGSANHPTLTTACQPTSLRMELHHSRRHYYRIYEEMQKFVYLLRRAVTVKLAFTPMLHLSLSAARFAHHRLHLDTWSWLTHMIHSISRSIGPSAGQHLVITTKDRLMNLIAT